MQQPSYAIVREQGPQHNKTFTVEVRIRRDGNNKPIYSAQGQGGTKKKGEQDAAKQALEYLQTLKKDNRSRTVNS